MAASNTAGVLRSIERAYGLSYLADAADAKNGTLGSALVSGRPVEGKFIGLYGIACPSATTCYAVGYDNANDADAVTTITSGQPGAAVTVPDAWYLNGIDCTSAGSCVAVGENSKEQGIIGALVDGKAGATTVVPGTEYLYGIGCEASGASCVATGASSQAANGYSSGVVVPFASGKAGRIMKTARTNGFGQVLPYGNGYLTVGAAYTA
jgi:hypothetical protein